MTIVDEAEWLGIVDDDEFGVEREAMKVALLVFAEDFEVARLRMIGRAMKGVVKSLGDGEEVFTAGNDVPAKGQSEIFGERNDAIQYFGNATADGSGVNHFDVAAEQRTSQDA
jgi:hypothetical protein